VPGGSTSPRRGIRSTVGLPVASVGRGPLDGSVGGGGSVGSTFFVGSGCARSWLSARSTAIGSPGASAVGTSPGSFVGFGPSVGLTTVGRRPAPGSSVAHAPPPTGVSVARELGLVGLGCGWSGLISAVGVGLPPGAVGRVPAAEVGVSHPESVSGSPLVMELD